MTTPIPPSAVEHHDDLRPMPVGGNADGCAFDAASGSRSARGGAGDVEELKPFQHEGAAFLAARKHAFLADVMGLGKTSQSIVACDMAGAQSILVLCPGSVKCNWEREFQRFSVMDRSLAIVDETLERVPDAQVVVCNYDYLGQLDTTKLEEKVELGEASSSTLERMKDLARMRGHFVRNLKARHWDVVILDEAHCLKNRAADRTKAVYGRGGNFPSIISNADHVWRLSGTPILNYADELWTHLRSAGVVNMPYWDFAFRFCRGFDADYGYKITGNENTDILKRMLNGFMLRRTYMDVKEQLPPLEIKQVYVERSPVPLEPFFFEQVAALGKTPEQFYGELKVADTTLRAALQAVEGGKRPNEQRLAILEGMQPTSVTLRRFVGLAKMPNICDTIARELENNAYDKIVLFAIHRDVIEETRKRLHRFNPVTFYGGTPAVKRQTNLHKFMHNKLCRVFIGNVTAAGVGLDGLQKVACEVAFMEQDWVPGKNAQAIMRVHRLLQENPVRVRVFTMHNSSDDLVQETIARKVKELTKIF